MTQVRLAGVASANMSVPVVRAAGTGRGPDRCESPRRATAARRLISAGRPAARRMDGQGRWRPGCLQEADAVERCYLGPGATWRYSAVLPRAGARPGGRTSGRSGGGHARRGSQSSRAEQRGSWQRRSRRRLRRAMDSESSWTPPHRPSVSVDGERRRRSVVPGGRGQLVALLRGPAGSWSARPERTLAERLQGGWTVWLRRRGFGMSDPRSPGRVSAVGELGSDGSARCCRDEANVPRRSSAPPKDEDELDAGSASGRSTEAPSAGRPRSRSSARRSRLPRSRTASRSSFWPTSSRARTRARSAARSGRDERPVADGGPVIADVVVRADGYWGDTAETHVAGANSEVEEARATLLEILEQARRELVRQEHRRAVFERMAARIAEAVPGGSSPSRRPRARLDLVRGSAPDPVGRHAPRELDGDRGRAGRLLAGPLGRPSRERLRGDTARAGSSSGDGMPRG